MLSLITKNNEIVKEFINENGRLTQVDNSDIINYDKYGNMLNTDKYVFTYNSRNLLETFTPKNITQTNNLQGIYTYNYQGVRSKKEIKDVSTNQLLKTVNYYLDGNKIIGEDIVYNSNNDETKKLRYFYDLEGIIGISYSRSYYSLLKDSIGNIKGIVHNGLLIGEYEYDAWGNHTIRSYINNDSSNINKEDEEFILYNNPFRYKGYYYDVETQLYWVSSRYYSPELCRWISPDDIEYLDPESINGLNLYCYCGNDPVMCS